MKTSGIVLAGGRSSRLGHDKVLEVVGSRSLLEQVISSISSLTDDIIIVTANKQTIPELTDYPGLKIVTDIYPGKGPLGGIYTGLAASASLQNLVVASDMPFLNQALLRYMIQLSADFDLVVPRVGKLVEPLHAVYTRKCLAPAEQLIKEDRLSILELFRLVRVRYVEAEEIESFDPQHLSFFNINTRTDLKRAREMVRGRQKL